MREWACWCVGASVHHKGGTGTATRVRNHEYMCMDVHGCAALRITYTRYAATHVLRS